MYDGHITNVIFKTNIITIIDHTWKLEIVTKHTHKGEGGRGQAASLQFTTDSPYHTMLAPFCCLTTFGLASAAPVFGLMI